MNKYITGLYFRLSQEDERAGESLSIDNQRQILRKYAEDHGFEIYGEYIDDGVSGTTFDRPEVQRLLDDAKAGVINTIIVKDLSRFGRNYIEVGQYLDYVFPAFGIRFIAIQDNVDSENRDSNAMEMMPIMNVFMQLQEIVGGNGNIFITFVYDVQNVPVTGNFFFVTCSGRCLFGQKLFKPCIGSADAFDFVGSFGTLYLCNLHELFKFLRLLPDIQVLFAFHFVNSGNICNDFRIPLLIFKGNVIKSAHSVSPKTILFS